VAVICCPGQFEPTRTTSSKTVSLLTPKATHNITPDATSSTSLIYDVLDYSPGSQTSEIDIDGSHTPNLADSVELDCSPSPPVSVSTSVQS